MDRVFALIDAADGTDQVARARAFELVLILVIGTEYWLRAVPKWGQLAPAYYGHLAIATLCCLVALYGPWRRVAFAVLAVSHAGLVWREFPSAGNHAYLEAVWPRVLGSSTPPFPVALGGRSGVGEAYQTATTGRNVT